jgi:hypothetical protein
MLAGVIFEAATKRPLVEKRVAEFFDYCLDDAPDDAMSDSYRFFN